MKSSGNINKKTKELLFILKNHDLVDNLIEEMKIKDDKPVRKKKQLKRQAGK